MRQFFRSLLLLSATAVTTKADLAVAPESSERATPSAFSQCVASRVTKKTNSLLSSFLQKHTNRDLKIFFNRLSYLTTDNMLQLPRNTLSNFLSANILEKENKRKKKSNHRNEIESSKITSARLLDPLPLPNFKYDYANETNHIKHIRYEFVSIPLNEVAEILLDKNISWLQRFSGPGKGFGRKDKTKKIFLVNWLKNNGEKYFGPYEKQLIQYIKGASPTIPLFEEIILNLCAYFLSSQTIEDEARFAISLKSLATSPKHSPQEKLLLDPLIRELDKFLNSTSKPLIEKCTQEISLLTNNTLRDHYMRNVRTLIRINASNEEWNNLIKTIHLQQSRKACLDLEDNITQVVGHFTVNTSMIADPNISVLNESTTTDIPSEVLHTQYGISVNYLVHKFEELVSSGLITDRMRIEDDPEDKKVKNLKLYIQNFLKYAHMLTGAPRECQATCDEKNRFEGKSEEAKEDFFWGDEYKERRKKLFNSIDSKYYRTIGDSMSLRKLLEPKMKGGITDEFKLKVVTIATHLQQKADKDIAMLLASWSAAGFHCASRSTDEIPRMYERILQENRRLDDEGIETIVALALENERRLILREHISEHYKNNNQGSLDELDHNLSYLHRRLFYTLGLSGDDYTQELPWMGCVKSAYKDPTYYFYIPDSEFIKIIKEKYTVERIIKVVKNALNNNMHGACRAFEKSFLGKGAEHPIFDGVSTVGLKAVFDPNTPGFTDAGVLKILASLGYLTCDRLKYRKP